MSHSQDLDHTRTFIGKESRHVERSRYRPTDNVCYLCDV